MSKLSHENNNNLIKKIRQYITIAITKPQIIIMENPYTNFAAVVAGICGLLAAAFSIKGTLVVFVIAIIIVIAGILIEARKYKIYTQETLPLPIVINIANPANEYDALNSLLNLIEKQPRYANYKQDIDKYLGLKEQDLVYKYTGDIMDQPRLISFLQITKKLIEKVKEKTPQDSIIYLAYIGPISVAWLIGSMLQRESMIIFQRNRQTNGYDSVMEVTDRVLKDKIENFEKFTIQEKISNSPQANLTIAIDTASHKIKLNNPEIEQYGDIIALENANSNTIKDDEIWLQYVKEIFHLLNEKQKQYKEIKLVYSMPVSLAIAGGIAIGDFWNIMLTNFNRDTQSYDDLIKINQVKYYF